jgi:ABC-type uncharacterized transport system ATPase subunit
MGKLEPSEGTIKIDMGGQQYDIRSDLQAAQSLMGTCSQHDILFDTLTVE